MDPSKQVKGSFAYNLLKKAYAAEEAGGRAGKLKRIGDEVYNLHSRTERFWHWVASWFNPSLDVDAQMLDTAREHLWKALDQPLEGRSVKDELAHIQQSVVAVFGPAAKRDKVEAFGESIRLEALLQTKGRAQIQAHLESLTPQADEKRQVQGAKRRAFLQALSTVWQSELSADRRAIMEEVWIKTLEKWLAAETGVSWHELCGNYRFAELEMPETAQHLLAEAWENRVAQAETFTLSPHTTDQISHGAGQGEKRAVSAFSESFVNVLAIVLHNRKEQLRRVHVNHPALSSTQFGKLCRYIGACRQLTHLDCRDTPLGVRGWRNIRDFVLQGAAAASLNKLNLANTKQGDETLKEYVKLTRRQTADAASLKELDLSQNQLTDQSFELLQFLPPQTALHLDLQGNPISKEAYQAWQARHPSGVTVAFF